MGWSQTDIAGAVGVSQAMVSKYLANPYPLTPFPEAEDLAREAADLINNGAQRAAINGLVCKWCFSFKEKGSLCRYHPVESCSVCMNLRSQEEVGERFRVLGDIETAVQRMQGMDIDALSPQVRINIAQATSVAEDSMDVAAIPGRLIPMAKGVRTLAPPEFGASRHLSSLLLAMMKRDPALKAVMNIRYDPSMDAILGQAPFNASYLDRMVFSNFEEFIGSAEWQKGEVLVDSGDFGIEPCAYIFGATAPGVVEKAFTLMTELNKNKLLEGVE